MNQAEALKLRGLNKAIKAYADKTAIKTKQAKILEKQADRVREEANRLEQKYMDLCYQAEKFAEELGVKPCSEDGCEGYSESSSWTGWCFDCREAALNVA